MCPFLFVSNSSAPHPVLHSFPTRRSSDLDPRQSNPRVGNELGRIILKAMARDPDNRYPVIGAMLTDLEHFLEGSGLGRSEEHTSELQSRFDLVCRLLLEKKKKQ